MRTGRIATGLAAAALAAAATPAATGGYTTPDGDIHFVESLAWFAADESLLANVDQEQDQWVRWVDTAPTDDTGAALMSAGPVSPIRQRTHGDDAEFKTQFTAVGTHTGHLDSLTLDLHFIQPGSIVPCDGNLEAEAKLGVDLEIDGVRVLDMAGSGDRNIYVPVTVDETETGHVARLKLVNLHERMGTDDLTAGPDATHEVRVSVQQFYLCQEMVWRYGSTDAPSSILFNRDPEDPSVADHTTIDAMNPPEGDPPTLTAPEFPDLP